MRSLLLALVVLQASCSPEGERLVARSADDEAVSGGGIWQEGDARNESSGNFQSLEVPGFLPAVIFLPQSSGPHPLIVAGHGAGGMPEWECDYWYRLSHGRAFLLCLRGERTDNSRPSGFYYRTHLTLGSEFEAALAAFQQRVPDAPRKAALYAGFSQGAIMGASMMVDHGDTFPYLALIEGGYDYWSAANARRFAEKGGSRVLFVCGTEWCANKAEVPAGWLREANVEVRIEHAPGAGHTPTGEVMERTRKALPWLTAGSALWQ